MGFASELMQYCKLKRRFTLPHCFYLLMKMKYFDVRDFFVIIEKTFNDLLRLKVTDTSKHFTYYFSDASKNNYYQFQAYSYC